MTGYPHRVAMITMHTSPLATPGVGDAGGLNVYVAELSKRLGERGIKVDVFTRADSTRTFETVEINEHTRVITVAAGPPEPVLKEQLPELVARLHRAPRSDDRRLRRDPFALLAVGADGSGAGRRHDIPLVHTMHTMARVKNASLTIDQDSEPDVRERGESAIVAGAQRADRQHPRRGSELVQHYGADPSKITIVPPGVDLHTFHPCDQSQVTGHARRAAGRRR